MLSCSRCHKRECEEGTRRCQECRIYNENNNPKNNLFHGPINQRRYEWMKDAGVKFPADFKGNKIAHPFAERMMLDRGYSVEQIAEMEQAVLKGSSTVVNEGLVTLTPEQKAFGISLGILSEKDFEGSVAATGNEDESFLDKYKRPERKAVISEFPELTKNELVLKAEIQQGKCWVHGGSLNGFYTTRQGGKRAFQLDVEPLHYPAKAVAKDAGMTLTKDHIHAGCHVCNDAMGDKFKVDTPVDEMREVIRKLIAGRGIKFLESNQVVSEEVLVTRFKVV